MTHGLTTLLHACHVRVFLSEGRGDRGWQRVALEAGAGHGTAALGLVSSHGGAVVVEHGASAGVGGGVVVELAGGGEDGVAGHGGGMSEVGGVVVLAKSGAESPNGQAGIVATSSTGGGGVLESGLASIVFFI